MKHVRHSFQFICLAMLLFCCFVHADQPAVKSVSHLDVKRYTGKWYEIAAFPMFFQRNCIGDTTAEYTLDANGEIDVVNRCRTENGFDQAKGKAWQANAASTSQLKVSFFWPFRADYWVIGLDDDYQWAVVGNPNRKYLWILARQPVLNKSALEKSLEAARAQGYDLSELRYTKHADGAVSR